MSSSVQVLRKQTNWEELYFYQKTIVKKVRLMRKITLILAVAMAAFVANAGERVDLPADVEGKCEVWLCAGQSNMQQGWGFYNETPEEKTRVAKELAQLDEVDIRFWDFNDGSWIKLTSTSPLAMEKCANGISFAIRRAKLVKKPVCILYVAAGGAPTEAFLSRELMCAVDQQGKPKYLHLCKIARNPNTLDKNDDFPCLWCKNEYPRRKGKAVEAAWWPVSRMYDEGIKRIEHLPLTGIYWYQGESNATRNVKPDEPLADDYMLETNLAIIEQLRGPRQIPFVMMGLPKMNRPWQPYRQAQRRACEQLNATYVDSFAAGLGDEKNVHPRNKIPFAELVMKTLLCQELDVRRSRAALSLDDVFVPRVVATPPNSAARDLCVTADGELRHYGFASEGTERRRVYVASRDGLSWRTEKADIRDCGAAVRSPWSGDWIYFVGMEPVELVRSKIGPGDVSAMRTPMPWRKLELRQLVPLKSRKRWLAAFSNIDCDNKREGHDGYRAATAYSDDDGRTWTRTDLKPVAGVERLAPGDKRPHWFNAGCEPTFVELKDGSILLCVRTSGPHAAFYRSTDGGATWGEGKPDPAFWQANTMPYFFRLKDGRILFIWNNTAMLPTRDLAEHPELGSGERKGVWETVFTNRDALHAAISDDEGKTWKGFRELALNEIRNAADFRELGNGPFDEHDKSVHQTQAVELPDGKVLLAYGQNRAARRMLVFDPDWLLETARTNDFRHGLGELSNHLYVRSLSGGWRGWAGHCAWNRIPGALLVRDPETDAPPANGMRSVREVLQLCRIRDPRLVSDRQGVVWNFPAARRGTLTLDCRIVGAGFRLTLADHWMNPCDEVGPMRSPLSLPVDIPQLRASGYHRLTVAWDCDSGEATLSVDGELVSRHRLSSFPRFGLSYLHLQTLAEDTDATGTYFREFRKEAKRDLNECL